MSDSIYQAPEAELKTDVEDAIQPYYVVSPTKFTVLFLGAMGIYSLYWFWKNWKIIKLREGSSLWPVPRAIFSVFFTHALFKNIGNKLTDRDVEYRWNPGLWATCFVVFSLVSTFYDRLAPQVEGLGIRDFISLAFIIPLWFSLLQGQKAANHASLDPEGNSNKRFSAVNFVFIGLGLMVWVSIIIVVLIAGSLEY